MLRTEYVSAILGWMPFFNGMTIRGGVAEKVTYVNTVTTNVMTITAAPNSGQHRGIAQDRRLRRAGAQGGTPPSRNSYSLILAFTCIRDTLFQKNRKKGINYNSAKSAESRSKQSLDIT